MNEYSKKIHLQGNAIARDLLAKLLENKDIVVTDVLDPNPEEQKKLDEQTMDFANSIVTFLANKGVSVNYATFAIDKLIGNLSGLKQFIDGTLRTWEDEYLSRSYGVKNDEGKYRKEEQTIAGLLLKLDEVRKATGDNKNDFYNEVAPELPVEDVIPSPFTPE